MTFSLKISQREAQGAEAFSSSSFFSFSVIHWAIWICTMANARVPKFGNWEDKGIPYTKCFENARKDIVGGSKPFNPNDPEENPEAFMSSKVAQGKISEKELPKSPSSPPRTSKVDSARSTKNMEPRRDKSSSNNPMTIPHSRSHHSTASPVHGSPTSSHVSSDNRSVHQKPASLPKFGSWKEVDQKPEAGYTVIFNGVKEKKQNAAANLTPFPPNATVPQTQNANHRRSSKKSCCFSPKTRE